MKRYQVQFRVGTVNDRWVRAQIALFSSVASAQEYIKDSIAHGRVGSTNVRDWRVVYEGHPQFIK